MLQGRWSNVEDNRPLIAIDGRLGLRWPRSGVGEYVYRLITELSFLPRPYDIKVFGDMSSSPDVAKRVRFLVPVELVFTPSEGLWDKTGFPQAAKGSALIHGAGGVTSLTTRIPRILTVPGPAAYSTTMRWILKRSPVVLTLTPGLQEELVRAVGIPEEKIVLTLPAPAIPLAEEPSPIKESYVLAEATDTPKSLDWALGVFAAAAATNPALRIRIILTDPKREAMAKRLIQRRRMDAARVEFVVPPSPADLAQLYRVAQAVLAGGDGFENLMVRLNGYAAATPVLAANPTKTPHDKLAEEAEAAVWVDPTDLDKAANRLNDIAQNAAAQERTVSQGQALVRELSWKRTAQLTHQAFLSVLEQRHRL